MLLKELTEVLSKDDDFYQSVKLGLFDVLKDVVCFYQQGLNRVLSQSETKAIITIYYLLPKVNELGSEQDLRVRLCSEISIKLIVEEFLLYTKIPLQISKETQSRLQFVDTSLSFNLKDCETVYERNGFIDSFYLIHLFGDRSGL